MENAADALKIAAAILIFIIAIASSFSLFGTAKQTADSIITMRDKQAYLDAAELEGISYETLDSVQSDGTKFTSKGDRIVTIADVVSTIQRYSIESYAVTIIKDKEVIARFDTSTESIMNNWSALPIDKKNEYTEILKKNLKNSYIEESKLKLDLEKIYNQGAPWLGNSEDIQKRINVDINGEEKKIGNVNYKGKGLFQKLKGKAIIEVTNEIDESKYLEDNGQATNLLQQYNMPTIEIIYIVNN